MKKIILSILVTGLLLASHAQIDIKTARVSRFFQPPRFADTLTGIIPIGCLMIRSTDNSLWLRGATQWVGISGAGGSSNQFQNGVINANGFVGLGGTLSMPTGIEGNNFDLALGTGNSPLQNLNINTSQDVTLTAQNGNNISYALISPGYNEWGLFAPGLFRSVRLDANGFSISKTGGLLVAKIKDMPSTTAALPSVVYDTITKEFKYKYISGASATPTLQQVLTAGNNAASQGLIISALGLDYAGFRNIGGTYSVNLNPVNQTFTSNYQLLLPLENDTLATHTWVRNYLASNGGASGSTYQFMNGTVNDGSGNISLGGTLTANTSIRLGNGSSPSFNLNSSNNSPLATFNDNYIYNKIGNSSTTLTPSGLEVNASQGQTSQKSITDTSGFRIVRNNGVVAMLRNMPRTTTAFPAVVYDTLTKEFKYNYINSAIAYGASGGVKLTTNNQFVLGSGTLTEPVTFTGDGNAVSFMESGNFRIKHQLSNVNNVFLTEPSLLLQHGQQLILTAPAVTINGNTSITGTINNTGSASFASGGVTINGNGSISSINGISSQNMLKAPFLQLNNTGNYLLNHRYAANATADENVVFRYKNGQDTAAYLPDIREALASVTGGAYVTANGPITAGVATKIVYDAKGLVLSGANATTSDIAEGTNKYYTDPRARQAISVTTNAGSTGYDANTGIINIVPGVNYWTLLGNDISRNTGNVGIGTTSPQYKLDVRNGGFRVGNNLFIVDSISTATSASSNNQDGGTNTLTTRNPSSGNFEIASNNGGGYFSNLFSLAPTFGFDIQSKIPSTDRGGRVRIQPLGVILSSNVSNSLSTSNDLIIAYNGSSYTDRNNSGGLKYFADYSSTLQPLSLTHVLYVKKLIHDSIMANNLGGGTNTGSLQSVTNAGNITTSPIIAGRLTVQAPANTVSAIQLFNDGYQPRSVIQSGNPDTANGGLGNEEGSIRFARGSDAFLEINSGQNNVFKSVTDANFEWWLYPGGANAYQKIMDLTENNLALNVPIKYPTQAGMAGKVLTSNASGILTLQTPVTGNTFKVKSTGNVRATTTNIDDSTELNFATNLVIDDTTQVPNDPAALVYRAQLTNGLAIKQGLLTIDTSQTSGGATITGNVIHIPKIAPGTNGGSGLTGLTTGTIPIATSATTIGNGPLSYNSSTSVLDMVNSQLSLRATNQANPFIYMQDYGNGASPQVKFETLNGSSATSSYFGVNGWAGSNYNARAGSMYAVPARDFVVTASGGDALVKLQTNGGLVYLGANGNVGVGTESPQAKFEVANGVIRMSSGANTGKSIMRGDDFGNFYWDYPESLPLLNLSGPQTATGNKTFSGNTTLSGGLQITSGTPGLNKFLTSDAIGNTSWKLLPTDTTKVNSLIDSALNATKIFVDANTIGGTGDTTDPFTVIGGTTIQTVETTDDIVAPSSGSKLVFVGVDPYNSNKKSLYLAGVDSLRRIPIDATRAYSSNNTEQPGNATLLFTDNFTTGPSLNGYNNWTRINGSKDGEIYEYERLSLSPVDDGSIFTQNSTGLTSIQNGKIEAELQQGHDTNLRLFFRVQNATNYYYIRYQIDDGSGPEYVKLYKVIGGTETEIAALATLNISEYTHFFTTVNFQGNTIKVIINGTEYSTTDNSISAGGRIGVGGGGVTYQAKNIFPGFKIYSY